MAKIQGQSVTVSKREVAAFNRAWPCSELRSTKAYWFVFETNGDLVDTNVSEQDDGSAALTMANDCQVFLADGIKADWML